MRISLPQNQLSRDVGTVSLGLVLLHETGFADGYLQMWRIGTSTSLTPAPRPPLELSMNPTRQQPPRPSPWHNCTTIASLLTGTLIWYVSERSRSQIDS